MLILILMLIPDTQVIAERDRKTDADAHCVARATGLPLHLALQVLAVLCDCDLVVCLFFPYRVWRLMFLSHSTLSDSRASFRLFSCFRAWDTVVSLSVVVEHLAHQVLPFHDFPSFQGASE